VKVSVVAFNVDGLNLAENRFYFLNNSLAFGRPKKIPPAITEKFGFKNLDENICVAVVKLQKELKTQESGSMPMTEYLKQNYDYTWPALIKLRIFLACYHLINGGQMPEIIYQNPSHMGGGNDYEGLMDNMIENGPNYRHRSHHQKKSPDEIANNLEKIKNLFEETIKITDEKNVKSLLVSLVLYQQSKQRYEILNDFIDLVICVETLVCGGGGSLRYKFALRSSLIAETKPEKRLQLFKKLQDIYKERNDLIHGNKLPSNPLENFPEYIEILTKLTKSVLPYYIEKLALGSSIEEINSGIDKLAVGFH